MNITNIEKGSDSKEFTSTRKLGLKDSNVVSKFKRTNDSWRRGKGITKRVRQ